MSVQEASTAIENRILSAAVENRILSSLQPRKYRELFSALRPVSFLLREVLYEAGQPIRQVYFPERGLISVIAKRETGNGSLELGMIGKEGIVGLSVFLGEEITPHRYVAQLPSAALALDVDIFKEAAERGGELQVLLQRFAQTFISQISQSTLCICFHNSEQRLARWLLLSQDYANSDEFPLTHEFVAQMLGIRRTGVTEAANLFKGANLIKYAYGKVSILNRQKLEAVSCSCYRIVTAQRKRLLGL